MGIDRENPFGTTEHPHKDVIIAVAMGKEVEFRSCDEHSWETLVSGAINPIHNQELEWRIKPNTIEDSYSKWSEGKGANCNDKLEVYTAGFLRGAKANCRGEKY
jgi:hypothetical protein